MAARFIRPLLLIVVTGVQAKAFVPQYLGFGDGERLEVNSPRRLGAEYESDRLTYQFLASWHYSWITEDKVFQYAAGSLGPKRFYTRGRFKIREDLGLNTFFQLTYAEMGDFKTNRDALVFEFGHQWFPWLESSLYGEAATLKKEDNVGLSSTIRFKNHFDLRFFHSFIHFSHNKRNELNDRYESSPAASGLLLTWANPENPEYMQVSLRRDKPLRQVFESGRVYRYSGLFFQFLSRTPWLSSPVDFFNSEINISKSDEGDTENTDGNIDSWSYQNIDGLLQIEHLEKVLRRYGVRYVYSQWRSSQGQVIHNNLIPHAWFSIGDWSDSGWSQAMELGYEFTWHRGQGDESLRGTLDRNNVVEHRLNYRYILNIHNKSELHALLSLDLDELDTGEAWEGGSLQYVLHF